MKTITTLLSTVCACVLAATAGAQTWSIIAKDVGTVATGIAFINSTFGYLPADANGNGAEILITHDGGKTWNYNAPKAGGFLFLDVTAYGSDVVVAGVFGEEYSDSYGNAFKAANGGGQGQCARNINRFGSGGNDGFGIAGQFGVQENNGVSVSFDGGSSFNDINVTELFTFARYAAFPTRDVFYVTAGQWPESNNDDHPSDDSPVPKNDDFNLRGADRSRPGSFSRTARFGAARHGKGYMPRVNANGFGGKSTGSFEAQVVTTQDGGKTWVSVFNYTGEFYPNGIDCESPTQCCFTAESDSGPAAGARIFCTYDAGKTWSQNFFQSGAQYSLIDLRWVDKGEYWAVGGVFGTFSATAQFLHTTDGGKSWQVAGSVSGYATAVDCTGPKNCWATVVDQLTQEASVAALQA